MPGINEKLLNVPIFYTKELTESIKEDKSAVNLARGDSEFQTPRPIIGYICKILPDPGENLDDFNASIGKWTHYEKGRGSKRLMEAIARKYQRECGLHVDTDEILITQAGMNAIYTAFLTVTAPGDEILIPDPCYVAYDPIANFMLDGRKGKRIMLREENDFILTAEELDRAKSRQTKALILTSPLNPTGSLYDKSQLEEIMDWGVRNDVFIIHDENHEKEIYDGNVHYPARLFDAGKSHSILLNSFSRLGMGGWRLGWIVAPKAVIKAATIAHSYINMTCNTFVQEAGAFTLDHYDELGFQAIFKEYEEKRNLLVPALNDLDGFQCATPKATCYAFPNISAFYRRHSDTILAQVGEVLKIKAQDDPLKERIYKRDLDLSHQSISYAVFQYLLLKAGVGVIPGTAYGPGSDSYIRFSFSVKREALLEAVRRLRLAFDEL